jgi:hypothetical protein
MFENGTENMINAFKIDRNTEALQVADELCTLGRFNLLPAFRYKKDIHDFEPPDRRHDRFRPVDDCLKDCLSVGSALIFEAPSGVIELSRTNEVKIDGLLQ